MGKTKPVAFLGTTKYDPTTYQWDGEPAESNFSPCGIAKIMSQKGLKPDEIVIVCTQDAQKENGEDLRASLELDVGIKPRFRNVPKGEQPEDFREMFQTLLQEFRGEGVSRLFVDITFGFRSQPFFAASVLTFVRALNDAAPMVRVLYAGNVKKGEPTQVWDLTPFVEVVDWAHALQLFLKTGRAGQVVQLAKSRGNEVAKEWSVERLGERPALDTLARKIGEFGQDLATLRTGDLLWGRENRPSSARKLVDAIRTAKEDVEKHLPPLADVLSRLEQMAMALNVAESANEPEFRAQAALARTYLDMERYVEAATTIREAWVSLYADPSAKRPGKGFDEDKREEAEKCCRDAMGQTFNEFGDLRNDLDHGGMNATPRVANTIVKNVRREVKRLEEKVKALSS